MGEYFKGKKLGTCDNLMYVTRKEIENRVLQYPMEKNTDAGNLPYLKDYLNLESRYIYRFEYEEEMGLSWNIDKDAFKTITFEVDSSCVEFEHREFSQVNLDNGECYNLPFCLYSEKSKESGIKKVSSPYKIRVSIVGERYTNDNPDGYTILKCSCCGAMFSLSEDEADNVARALRFAGYEYESNKIKPFVKRETISKVDFISKVIADGTEDMWRGIIDNKYLYEKLSKTEDESLTEKLAENLELMSIEKINAFSKKYLCNYIIN